MCVPMLQLLNLCLESVSAHMSCLLQYSAMNLKDGVYQHTQSGIICVFLGISLCYDIIIVVVYL